MTFPRTCFWFTFDGLFSRVQVLTHSFAFSMYILLNFSRPEIFILRAVGKVNLWTKKEHIGVVLKPWRSDVDPKHDCWLLIPEIMIFLIVIITYSYHVCIIIVCVYIYSIIYPSSLIPFPLIMCVTNCFMIKETVETSLAAGSPSPRVGWHHPNAHFFKRFSQAPSNWFNL